ncbi:Inactive serine/threonine-protein kinase TEX14 [Anthophora plagiata]
MTENILSIMDVADWCSQRKKNSQGYGRFVKDIGSGDRQVIVSRLGFRANSRQPVSRVVRSVRRKYRGDTSAHQAISCEKEANRLDPRASRSELTFSVLVGIAVFTCQLVKSYLRVVGRCATCAMGMMGMFKWLRKDIVQRDRNGWNLTQKQCGLNNESYRNALQAFIDRRRNSDDTEIEIPSSPDKKRADLLAKNNNNKCDNEQKSQEPKSIIPGVPHIPAPEIFEIGWVAGTEDRYLELIFAEWQNTRVSLKRHSHPECKDAVKADLDILSEIRHPNVLLLMASTYTDDHGLVSIFESVDCTLYHYIHDQGERISIQGIAKCGGRLSDALRHSHMRGYVHTAISSHCVFLASSGVVKLGGWELAMHINNPKQEREYEERLRSEIYHWQAPELFHGYEPGKESDVYGLALLIWEMCTMHVPWNGYSKADVERQYLHWKRGVIMDLYDFPPLLNNLLEAGLQLDVNKRTLDMNRMRRFLQRLEMQYEDEEPVYIDQYANNNNDIEKTYILPTMRSPMGVSKKVSDTIRSEEVNPDESLHPWNSTYRKVKAPQETEESRTTSVYSSPLLESTDDESFKDAKTTLKQLKKVLANRREHFFYGSDSSRASAETSPTKNEIFNQAKSKDYEPHKPASHKTSLELKCSKSPNQYDPTYMKSSFQQYRKIPYLHTSENAQDSITQPQVLNSDPQSFFETSLWRKEKLICLSKMRKTHADEFETNNNDTISTETVTKNQTVESNATNSDNTYVINRNSEERSTTEAKTSEEKFTQMYENASESTEADSSCSKPLQVLKDALDRATKIVRSITPNTEESCSSPPFKYYQDFEDTVNDNQICKSIFENLYGFQVNNDNEEIKTIERSTTSGKTFLFDKNINNTTTSKDMQTESENNITISITNFENTSHSHDATYSRNFICESIAEVSSEFNTSHNDTNSGERAKSISTKTISIKEDDNISEIVKRNRTMVKQQSDIEAQVEIKEDEKKSDMTDFNLMLLNDAAKNKNCKTCHQSALPRRRSLPAALSQLRAINNSALGKLPIRRGDIPDSTVEDLYIDDEFGDSLNVNMVLLDEDLSVDEDFLPEMSEL